MKDRGAWCAIQSMGSQRVILVPGTSGRVSTLKELQRCFCPAHSGGDGYRALGGGTGTVTSAQDLREGRGGTRPLPLHRSVRGLWWHRANS